MSIYFREGFERAFGTFPLLGAELRAATLAAVDVGYRAFDTAQWYGNEAALGAALQETGLPRAELCITTKVAPDNYDAARFLPSVERSLKDLRVDRVDVLLLHWPPAGGDVRPSLRLLQQAHDRGLAREVGISNYTVRMMHEARATLDAPVACNQVEFHPLLDQELLLAAAEATGIPLSAYCAVARGKVCERPELARIGAVHGKTAVQVALRWILQKGVAVTAMSTRPANIRANFAILDFELAPAEMRAIDAMTAANCRIVGKAQVPFAPEFD